MEKKQSSFLLYPALSALVVLHNTVKEIAKIFVQTNVDYLKNGISELFPCAVETLESSDVPEDTEDDEHSVHDRDACIHRPRNECGCDAEDD